MNIGASKPPEVPAPNDNSNASDLHTATSNRIFRARLLFRISERVVVPHAEHAGNEKANDAKRQRADRRMPKFGDRNPFEMVLHEIKRLREANSDAPHNKPRTR